MFSIRQSKCIICNSSINESKKDRFSWECKECGLLYMWNNDGKGSLANLSFKDLITNLKKYNKLYSFLRPNDKLNILYLGHLRNIDNKSVILKSEIGKIIILPLINFEYYGENAEKENLIKDILRKIYENNLMNKIDLIVYDGEWHFFKNFTLLMKFCQLVISPHGILLMLFPARDKDFYKHENNAIQLDLLFPNIEKFNLRFSEESIKRIFWPFLKLLKMKPLKIRNCLEKTTDVINNFYLVVVTPFNNQ